MRKRMFRRGNKLKRIGHVVERALRGEWLIFGRKPMHPGWVTGMTVRALEACIRYLGVYVAVRNR